MRITSQDKGRRGRDSKSVVHALAAAAPLHLPLPVLARFGDQFINLPCYRSPGCQTAVLLPAVHRLLANSAYSWRCNSPTPAQLKKCGRSAPACHLSKLRLQLPRRTLPAISSHRRQRGGLPLGRIGGAGIGDQSDKIVEVARIPHCVFYTLVCESQGKRQRGTGRRVSRKGQARAGTTGSICVDRQCQHIHARRQGGQPKDQLPHAQPA